MPHSPLPFASTQPTGAAYRPRSMNSSSRISSIAVPDGVPHTAAVGCRAAASCRADACSLSTPPDPAARIAASRPVTCVARCCTLASRSSDGSASMSSRSQNGASALRTSATAYRCSSTSLADASSAAPSLASSASLRPRRVVPASTSELTAASSRLM